MATRTRAAYDKTNEQSIAGEPKSGGDFVTAQLLDFGFMAEIDELAWKVVNLSEVLCILDIQDSGTDRERAEVGVRAVGETVQSFAMQIQQLLSDTAKKLGVDPEAARQFALDAQITAKFHGYD